MLWIGVLVCVVYLGCAVLVGTVAGDIAGLPWPQRRTLVCTLGTRNSFVVLPIALALPAGWELAAAVVVAVLGTAAFARRQRRLADPLLTLDIFRSRIFVGGVLAAMGSMFVITGTELHVNGGMYMN